jgi:hypothetical protein
VKEEFLKYLWRFRLYHQPLFSTKGEKIEIIKPGLPNSNAGADFLEAKVKIGDTVWAGNIEIHVLSSDWNKHRHQKDKAYNNTVLHVVNIFDTAVFLENGEEISCIELKEKYDPDLLHTYEAFMSSKKWIPCSGQISTFPEINFQLFYSRLLVERLEEKTDNLNQRLVRNKNDWEETFYQVLAGGFGLKINQELFSQLAESLPLRNILRQQNSLFQLEALFFGQSGLLDIASHTDEYVIKLKKEYALLAKKYNIVPLAGHLWKFLRIRPANFPTLRIAQFSAFLFKHQNLFSKIIEIEKFEELKQLFQLEVSAYWKNHYIFAKSTKNHAVSMSTERINLQIINTLLPVLFLYGRIKKIEPLKERALSFFELIPAEENNIIRSYKNEGIMINSAFQTQALIQLKSKYCNFKKCLDCPIGSFLLIHPNRR